MNSVIVKSIVGAAVTGLAAAGSFPTNGVCQKNCINATSFQIGQQIRTTSGLVNGHASGWAPEVSEYLGIPFGESTAGNNRFAAPKPYLPPNSTQLLPGDQYPPDCPIYVGPPESIQNANLAAFFAAGDPRKHTLSEACLGLNIWTKPQTGDQQKPVMVYFYGGAFNSGTSNNSVSNGALLAEWEDVIIVTFNYRTDILGFASGPDFPAHNFGLLDQRLAVEWVQANIAAFGGDPARITLFGQSAGAMSIDMYAYAYVSDPIVAGFITQSGNVGTLTRETPGSFARWANVSQAAGCGNASSSAATLDCMRKKPIQDILNAQAKVNLVKAFGPVVDNKTVFADYAARGAAGNFIKKPLFAGGNSNESLFFASRSPVPLPATQLATLNLAFNCPVAAAVHYRAAHGVPVWRYRYFGYFENSRFSNETGAAHSSELTLLFRNADRISGIENLFDAEVNRDKMTQSWAQFARDPEKGLVEVNGWDVYDDNGKTLVGFAYQNGPILRYFKGNEFDAECGNSTM